MKLDQIWEHYTKWLKAKSLTPSKTKNNLPASLRLRFPDVYTGTKTRAYRLKLRNGPQIG